MENHSLIPRGAFDYRPVLNFDGAGKAYIAITVIWTIFLFGGLIALILLRNLTFIRIRNVTLATASVLTIHVYLVLVLIYYVLNGLYPCNFEYWIMSIYLPFGIALFQAQNVRLLDMSGLQRRLMLEPDRPASKTQVVRKGLSGLRDRWRHAGIAQRTYVGIGIGVVVQIIVAFAIFFLSRKFHAYGITSQRGDVIQCRHGWEWLPSAFWQAIWTFGFGPYILWKIRNIHDVHRWKLQTALSIVCGLPGLPLVIAAMYSPAFKVINSSWPPPMWFAPGLMMMQFVTVFFPLIEAYEARYRRKLTLSALDEWEKSRNKGGSLSSDSLRRTSSLNHTEKQERRDMYGMHALERTLSNDSSSLLEFAATREFTGENIIFLTQVRDWKRMWDRIHAGPGRNMSPDNQRMLYNKAAELFFGSVCLLTAQFPVNIESKVYVALEKMFRRDASGDLQKSIITPFADDVHCGSDSSLPSRPSATAEKIGIACTTIDEEAPAPGPCPLLNANIPRGFDRTIFDGAEQSVKYMVFTQTWARYIDATEAASVRSGSQRSSKSKYSAKSKYSSNSGSSRGSSFFGLRKSGERLS
ncbi:MAG: Vacuolar protein sorting-associated protein 5 [Watsoniomyces obsoletus]|nr:MAG: Vacuolar protein sorting-associated protein 5 [Watsoniomyces obsoletus]